MPILIKCLLQIFLLSFAGCVGNTVSNEANVSFNASSISKVSRAIAISADDKVEKVADRLIWQGQVEEFQLRWTSTDISIKKSDGSQRAFLLSEYVKQKVKRVADNILSVNPEAKGEPVKVVVTAKIKSVFGSVVSFEISYLILDKFVPVGNMEWLSIDFASQSVLEDLDKSFSHALEMGDGYLSIEKSAPLMKYFSDLELTRSLLNNSKINKYIRLNVKKHLEH